MGRSDVIYAHSRNGTCDTWQTLDEHLENVASVAADFSTFFGAHQWGELLGHYHDVGKATFKWQAWLRNVNGIVDEFAHYYNGHPTHSAAGAQWLYAHSKEAGKLMAYCIAGHHAGLPNWEEGSFGAGLKKRLLEPMVEISGLIEPSITEELPFEVTPDRFGFQLQFFTRMLFSCLVDADYLDTEHFLEKGKAGWRSRYPEFGELVERFWNCFNALRQRADPSSNVNRQRELVLAACLDKSKMRPGLFSLTVPTGGGKTLASLAFALEHAKQHGKRRIIYVIPFTSIIEQNARVFREMLGEDAVLEHHCNFIPDEADWKTRLASENWDAPVIVTTNVQFFNSFYANKTSKCRKLHNVSESVVIFDEVQAIPVERLHPCLEVIKELSESYGVTSILCTATQPAIEHSEQFEFGLKNVEEIVEDVHDLFRALKRTEEKFIGSLSEQELAKRLSEQSQVLCIVNSRQQALDVFDSLIPSDSNIHLSAVMHPQHRTRTLDEVRRRLEEGLSCRVVSTQLIEAGVDVDFPCVYRAVSGIDSIAQAAGRCNRNGKHPLPCPVFVFEFPESFACAFFRQAAQSASKLFGDYTGRLTDPDCVLEYFADYFWKNEQRMDEYGTVQKCFQAATLDIQFKDIAEFQMIKTATLPVIIALDQEAVDLVTALEFVEHAGGILRRLQKYTVQVYSYQFDEIRGWLEEPAPGVFVLKSKELYSDSTGLKCRAPEGQAFFG